MSQSVKFPTLDEIDAMYLAPDGEAIVVSYDASTGQDKDLHVFKGRSVDTLREIKVISLENRYAGMPTCCLTEEGVLHVPAGITHFLSTSARLSGYASWIAGCPKLPWDSFSLDRIQKDSIPLTKHHADAEDRDLSDALEAAQTSNPRLIKKRAESEATDQAKRAAFYARIGMPLDNVSPTPPAVASAPQELKPGATIKGPFGEEFRIESHERQTKKNDGPLLP